MSWGSGGGFNWAPGGVFSDDVVDGDSSSGDQSWGNRFGTLVFFTRGNGNQSSGVLSDRSGGDVLSGSDGGNSGEGGDGRELHF